MANSKYTKEEVSDLLAGDEPTFIFRAQDKFAPQVIKFYKDLLVKYASENDGSYEDAAKVRGAEKDFLFWQENNPSRVKVPTI